MRRTFALAAVLPTLGIVLTLAGCGTPSPRPADPSTLSDEEWRDFLFIRTNARGPHYERWRHVHGCGRFFNALRDTVSDRFLMTYKAGEERPAPTVLEAAE